MGKLHKLRTLKNLTLSVPLSMTRRGGSQAQGDGGEVNVRTLVGFTIRYNLGLLFGVLFSTL